MHNTYFPETAIKVIGFGRNENGDFQVIVEQPFIQGEKITQAEIKTFLEGAGFEKDENNDNYRNENVIIEDVHMGNAIKTPQGNIVVIDPIMRLNTSEQGYGGNRTIDNSIQNNNNAQEQQSGSVRNESQQEQTQITSDSNLPISNEAELQNRQEQISVGMGSEIEPNQLSTGNEIVTRSGLNEQERQSLTALS